MPNKLLLIFLKFSSIIFSFELLRKIFRISIEPGDVVIFDCLLIHASDVGGLFQKICYLFRGWQYNFNENFQLNNVVPEQVEETSEDNEDIFKNPNRYTIQTKLYEGDINSFGNVLRNLKTNDCYSFST